MKTRLESFLRFMAGYKKNAQISYSQCGEDLIVKFIFDAIGVSKPSYLDIGAHDPFYFSNTALFYQLGSRGVNIEPDPKLFEKIAHFRKRDINLNIGVSDNPGEQKFYFLSSSTLNTFSQADADKAVAEHGQTITNVATIKVDTVANVVARYCNNVFPDFLSLDVEGLDSAIIRSMHGLTSLPTVICCETMSYSHTGRGVKNQEIIDLLRAEGYMVYADTYINTIFLVENKWLR